MLVKGATGGDVRCSTIGGDTVDDVYDTTVTLKWYLAGLVYIESWLLVMNPGGSEGYAGQGYILLPKSLAKGIYLTKTPKNWHFGTQLASFIWKFLLKRE